VSDRIRIDSCFLATFAFILLRAASASAGQLTLAWNPVTSSNISTYRLAYGTTSGVYTTTLDVGNVTTYTLTGLTVGVRYFFVAFAVDTSAMVSPPSSEVSDIVPCASSLSPTQFAASAAGGSSTVTVTAGACGWTATSSVPWLTVTAGATGTGNGTVSYAIASNTSTTARTGTLTIGGKTLTVTQAGQVATTTVTHTIVWQNDTTRQAVMWRMGGTNGATLVSTNWLSAAGTPGWKIVGSADFNRDGHLDVLWQNDLTGQIGIWYLDETAPTILLSASLVPSTALAGWTVVGIADFDGDGHADVVVQHDTTRQVSVWYLGGAQGNTWLRSGWLSSVGTPGWRVAGIADLDRDGHPDIIWQSDTTGQPGVWFMGGTQGDLLLGSALISSGVNTGWTVVGTADFNGDGYVDLVWQYDPTSQAGVWYLGGAHGSVPQAYGLLSTGMPGWRAISR
jgi:FG-GAP-like repeat/Viral BACON domain/Fibronectin type III domain